MCYACALRARLQRVWDDVGIERGMIAANSKYRTNHNVRYRLAFCLLLASTMPSGANEKDSHLSAEVLHSIC